jgi:uncharacterized protein GlcG (DUF336 family)
MTDLTLSAAQSIVTAALAYAREKKFLPLAVSVLDARGALKAFMAEDGTSLKRGEIAVGKAHGALSLGMGSRALMKRAADQPTFIAAMSHIVGGSLVPVPGGVLIRDADGKIIGCVGISGDTSDNDEAAALAGIAAAGLKADPGAG